MSFGSSVGIGAGLSIGGGAKLNAIPAGLNNSGSSYIVAHQNVGIGADLISQDGYLQADQNVGIGSDQVSQNGHQHIDQNVVVKPASNTRITPTIN